MNRDSAKAAAKWWADQLRGGAKLDNGATDPANVMARGLAGMLQKQEASGRTPQSIDLFEAALARRFEAIDGARCWGSIAGVDYHPDRILSEAADEAGINLGMASLPWKTSMHCREGDKITVHCGYRAPEEVVYDPAAQTAAA